MCYGQTHPCFLVSFSKKKKSLLNDGSTPVRGDEIIFSRIQICVQGCTAWHSEGDNIWQKQAQVLTCSRDLLPFCKWNRWGFWLTVSCSSSSGRGLRRRLRSGARTTSQIGISSEVWHERSNPNNVNTISVSHAHPNFLIKKKKLYFCIQLQKIADVTSTQICTFCSRYCEPRTLTCRVVV